MQAARKGIVVLVELAARVQLGEHDLDARDARLRVDVRRDAAAVVLDGGAAVRIQFNLYARRVTVGGLVDGVVDDLPEDVVQPLDARRTDVHARAQAHRVQPLEYAYVFCAVFLIGHAVLLVSALAPRPAQNAPYFT